MAKPARQIVVRPLKEREELLVLEALFELPLRVGEIADKIKRSVDGPDLSHSNLQNIIARLGGKVRKVPAMGDIYWYLSPAAYETQLGTNIDLLLESLRAYRRYVRKLKQSGQ